MDRDWEELFGALRDGTITPEDESRLDRLLAGDPAAQQAYLE